MLHPCFAVETSVISEDNSESMRDERNRYEQHASHCHVSMEAFYLHSDLVPYTESTQELVFFFSLSHYSLSQNEKEIEVCCPFLHLFMFKFIWPPYCMFTLRQGSICVCSLQSYSLIFRAMFHRISPDQRDDTYCKSTRKHKLAGCTPSW